MRKIGLGAAWLVTLLVGTLLLSGWLGWLDMERALELVMGTVALGGLWLVVWLPWDLFFAARALAVELRLELSAVVLGELAVGTGARPGPQVGRSVVHDGVHPLRRREVEYGGRDELNVHGVGWLARHEGDANRFG